MVKWLLMTAVCFLGGAMITTPMRAQACSPAGTPTPSDSPFDTIHVTSTVIDNGVVPATDAAFDVALADYLNQHGTADLSLELNGIGSIQWDDFMAPVSAQVFERDVSGDGVAEVIVMIDLNSGAGFSAGIFRYDCQNGRYSGGQIARTSGWRVENSFGDSAPEIKALVDLTGDRLPEMVVYRVLNVVGAFDDTAFTIFDAKGKLLGEVGNGNGEVRDSDRDGLPDLVTHAPFYKSSDSFSWSRLGRDTDTVWKWDGHTFSPVCHFAVTPPSYRVQAVLDGGTSLACGHYQQAVAFYQQAIEDNTLIGWSEADNLCPGCDPAVDYDQWAVMAYEARQQGFSVPDTDERPRLTAYARYRLVVTYASLNQTAEAEQELTRLAKDFPAGAVGHEYVLLAQTFRDTFKSKGDVKSACQQVNDSAGQLESPLNHYAFAGVNSGIVDVKWEAVCPL